MSASETHLIFWEDADLLTAIPMRVLQFKEAPEASTIRRHVKLWDIIAGLSGDAAHADAVLVDYVLAGIPEDQVELRDNLATYARALCEAMRGE